MSSLMPWAREASPLLEWEPVQKLLDLENKKSQRPQRIQKYVRVLTFAMTNQINLSN